MNLLEILKKNADNAKSYIDGLVSKKQDTLTFDTAPTEGSQNPVTSDGIQKAIAAKTVDLSNYPTKNGTGASGTWGISITGNASTATKLATPRTLALTGKVAGSATFDGSANTSINVTSVNADTASKLSTARKINITGNATGSTSFDGSGDVSINTTVNESKHAAAADTLKSSAATETSTVARPVWLSWEGDNTKQTVSPNLTYTCSTKTLKAANFAGHLAGNADSATTANTANTATKLATARTISLTGNASGSANFDGSGNVSINTTVSQATNADKVDGYHENSFLRYRGAAAATGEDTLWSQIGIKEYDGKLPKGVSGTYNYGSVVSLPGVSTRLDIWYNHQCSTNKDGLWYRSGYGTDQKAWARLLDSNNYTNWAPTKTGAGASGTWGISISGNANTASSVAWSGVTGKPGTYPPSAHNHDSAYPSVTGTRASGTWGISITGNAASATKATQDASGNVIADTYATKAALSTKQEKLTFDTTPTKGSTNPVTSDGIKKAIDAKTIDLSNYYTKAQVDSAISTAISAIVDGNNKSY